MKALIVHSRRTGLGIIRSLGRKGVDIYVADIYKSAGFYSKYTKGSVIIPKLIEVGEEKFLQILIDFGEKYSRGEKIFLFTPSDDYLFFFVKHWDKLKLYFNNTFETNFEKLKDNLEKTKMYKIAEKAKVSYPFTFYSPVNSINVKEYPVIIKPALKKTSKVDVVKEAFRIKFCNSKDELDTAIGQLEKINIGYVVQQYIPGDDDQLYTAGIFAYKGNLIAAGTSRKLRQFPPKTGECSYGELVDEPKIIEYSKQYIEESGITGMCQVEFKKYKGDFYLMEINPRPWSWNSIMDYAGINLPYIAIKTILSDDKSKFYHQKKFEGNWIHSLMDFKHNVKENKNISFLVWLKSVLKSEKHAFWSISDPLPVFRNVYEYFKYH